MTGPTSQRIEIVDALRGWTILAIMIFHNIEHFNYYNAPDGFPEWLQTADLVIWKLNVFLFGGKAYGVFALLFGFAFYIQLRNSIKRSTLFSGRFMRRMFLLFLLGTFNSIFFKGDILAFYAVLGVFLLPVGQLSDKAVIFLALTLLLQPVELLKLYNLANSNYIPVKAANNNLFKDYTATSSFIELVQQNLTTGRAAVCYWLWESGRITQIFALFMLGMLLGRNNRFGCSKENHRFWLRTLLISTALFVPLLIVKVILSRYITPAAFSNTLKTVINSWFNMAFMFILVSGFVIIYYKTHGQNLLSKLSAVGRMSLSNYVMQSVIGSFLYYGYGLGLYKYTGATYSLLIAMALCCMQIYFSGWWLKRHKHGPLEYIWRRATWI